MSNRIEYQSEISEVKDTYLNISVIPSAEERYSFSIHYRKTVDQHWFDDADLVCNTAHAIVGNTIYGVEGSCTVRWNFGDNGLFSSDILEIEIRPECELRLFSQTPDGVSLDVSIDGVGLVDIQTVDAGTLAPNLVFESNTIYWNGTSIISGVDSESHVSSFDFLGNVRILIADPTGKIEEYTVWGTLIASLTGSFGPIFAQYDPDTGNMLYVDSSTDNVIEVYWKDPSIGWETNTSFGVEIWDYNSDISTPALSDVVSATYGTSGTQKSVAIVDEQGLVFADRDAETGTRFSSIDFETSSDTSSANLSLIGSQVAYEYGEGRMVVVVSKGADIPYTDTSASHTTYNRSLGGKASTPVHEGLWNALYAPIDPVTSENYNLTLQLMNTGEMEEKTRLSPAWNEISSLGTAPKGLQRGNVFSDIPEWGFQELDAADRGTRTLVGFTGQSVRISIPHIGTRRGYAKSGSDYRPVVVSEEISSVLRSASSGSEIEVMSKTSFTDDLNFTFSLPSADSTSYKRSLVHGWHHQVVLEVVVTEKYWSSVDMDEQIFDSRSFSYAFPITCMWWRQVFKEYQTSISPVSNYSFTLENYTETPSQFFDNWTHFPDFYRVVGGVSIEPSVEQKSNIILDNAYTLLTFGTGILPGDSPLSDTYCTNPVEYSQEAKFSEKNLARIGMDINIPSPLFGLQADYQTCNVFPDYPGTPSGFNQSVQDYSRVYFINKGAFAGDRYSQGMFVVPSGFSVLGTVEYVLDSTSSLTLGDEEPDLRLDYMGFYVDTSLSREIRPGDKKCVVAFGTQSADIEKVQIHLSVDDEPYQVFKDPSGNSRFFEFGTGLDLQDYMILRSNIIITDSNGTQHLFTNRKSLAPEKRTSSIKDIRLFDNREGKTLTVEYELDVAYTYIPVSVEISASIGGETISDWTGDTGNVFGRSSLRCIASYANVAESTLDETSTLTITASDPIVGSVKGESAISFVLRGEVPPRRFPGTDAFTIVATEEEDVDPRIERDDLKDDQLIFIKGKLPYAISSSSSSSSKRSLSLSSSSESLSSCSSSSSNSSSSFSSSSNSSSSYSSSSYSSSSYSSSSNSLSSSSSSPSSSSESISLSSSNSSSSSYSSSSNSLSSSSSSSSSSSESISFSSSNSSSSSNSLSSSSSGSSSSYSSSSYSSSSYSSSSNSLSSSSSGS